jgi:hypothetical protein
MVARSPSATSCSPERLAKLRAANAIVKNSWQYKVCAAMAPSSSSSSLCDAAGIAVQRSQQLCCSCDKAVVEHGPCRRHMPSCLPHMQHVLYFDNMHTDQLALLLARLFSN